MLWAGSVDHFTELVVVSGGNTNLICVIALLRNRSTLGIVSWNTDGSGRGLIFLINWHN